MGEIQGLNFKYNKPFSFVPFVIFVVYTDNKLKRSTGL